MNFASATNLNFYKVFFAVYETGSITQAGEQLFIAPSTISYQVKELENQLSTKLFMPHPRGVSPTHAAVELYEIAKPAFAVIYNGEAGLQEFNEDSVATLKIKFPTYFGNQIMSRHVAAFRDKYKNVSLEVRSIRKSEGMRLLENNELDLSFSTIAQVPKETDTIGVIVIEEFAATMFASKEFAAEHIPNKKVTRQELEHLPMISVGKTYAARGILENLGFAKPVVEVETTDIMLNLVAANMGIGCYANESIDSDDRLTKIELVDCKIPNFYLVCLYNKKYCSKAAKAFISLLN